MRLQVESPFSPLSVQHHHFACIQVFLYLMDISHIQSQSHLSMTICEQKNSNGQRPLITLMAISVSLTIVPIKRLFLVVCVHSSQKEGIKHEKNIHGREIRR